MLVMNQSLGPNATAKDGFKDKTNTYSSFKVVSTSLESKQRYKRMMKNRQKQLSACFTGFDPAALDKEK